MSSGPPPLPANHNRKPVTPATAESAPGSRQAWLILGACGCALLLLGACGLGAAIMAPNLARYWSKISPALPVTITPLPALQRDK